MTDLRQTKEYTEYMESLGWEALQLNKQSVYLRKLPLLGCVAKMQRPQKTPTCQEIETFCKKHSIRIFYLEPVVLPGDPGKLLKAKSSFVPPRTIIINLQTSEGELLKNCKSKTRYNIGLAKRRSVVVKQSESIETFVALWQESARKRGMWLPQRKEIGALWKAFKNKRDLLLAYHNNKLLGGVFLCYSPDIAYYMYACSTKKGKELFAPTFLAWEAIALAKKKKKKFFDFEGVYDSRYPSTKTWKGFTKFKEGFGGEALDYPPTLVYHKNPFLRFLGV